MMLISAVLGIGVASVADVPEPVVVLNSPIADIQFSRDGKYLAVSGMQGDIVVLEAGTWNKLHQFKFSSSRVSHVAFSPDNSLLATSGQDGHIRLVTLSGQAKHTFSPPRGGQAGSISFSPDGTKIVGTAGEPVMRCWDTATGKEVWNHDPGANGTVSVRWSPKGDRIVYGTGGVAGTFVVLDSSGKKVGQNSGHVGGIRFITFSADGAHVMASVARGGNAPALVVMNPTNGATVHDFESLMVDGYFLPYNSAIVGLGGDGELRVFEMGSKSRRYKGNPILKHRFFRPERMALSPDGKKALIAGDVTTGYGFFVIDVDTLK